MLTADLLELQDVDTSIDQARHRRTQLAERGPAADAERALGAATRRRTEIDARNGELDRAVEELEQAGHDLSQQRTRLEGQLRMVTSTRQADALQHELDALAARRDELDDRELGHLDEQADLAAELAALDEARPSLVAEADATAAALGAAEGAIDAELASLTTARATLVERIEPAWRERYETLRTRFGGVAVAHLEGSRCTGCHLDLSTVELADVRSTPAGQFADCPQCGRLLVP